MKSLKNLPQETRSVFLKLSGEKHFKVYTFVGGSALSVYLNHRKSEDVDLFTYGEIINKETLINIIQTLYPGKFSIDNATNKQLNVNISGVKVTFFANNWDELKKQRKEFVNNIKIASIELLTAMKLNTLFLRAKFRDYYDLYVLSKEIYSISQMYEIIVRYMPHINMKLFQMALIFTDDIEEDNIKHLEPKYEISILDIQKHFQKEIKKML